MLDLETIVEIVPPNNTATFDKGPIFVNVLRHEIFRVIPVDIDKIKLFADIANSFTRKFSNPNNLLFEIFQKLSRTQFCSIQRSLIKPIVTLTFKILVV